MYRLYNCTYFHFIILEASVITANWNIVKIGSRVIVTHGIVGSNAAVDGIGNAAAMAMNFCAVRVVIGVLKSFRRENLQKDTATEKKKVW